MDAVLGEVSGQLEVGADVEGLALGLGIGVVALYVAIATKASLRRSGVDGIVLALQCETFY